MIGFFRKNKLVLSLCVIFIVIICLVINMACIQKQKLIDTHKAGLQMLANEKAAQVNMFFEFQKERIANLGSMTVFKEVALYPNDPSKIEAAKNLINQLKDTIPEIRILTKEGIVIIGDRDLPGTDYSMVPVFPASDKMPVFFSQYYDHSRGGDYYAVGGLIYDDQKNKKVIGVIGFDMELSKISGLMKETLGGKNSEVYLINETGLLLSGSKYIDQDNESGILLQEIKSKGAEECLADLKEYGKENAVEEHEEEVFQYLNYMGNEVFGAHAYVLAINGCVIAEESADEILGDSMLDYISNIFSKK